MTKKRSGLVAFRRRNKKPAPRPQSSKNPPLGQDFKDLVVPAFVTYAGVRLTTRIVHNLTAKRFPRLSRHLAALSSVAAFAGAYTLVHRFEKTKKYHDGAVVGSAIAAGQTVIQTYVPRYGWMMADLDPPKPAVAAPAPTQQLRGDDGDMDGGPIDHSPGESYGILSGGSLSISDDELDELESML